MAAAPTASSHQWPVSTTTAMPAMAATPKHANAADRTCTGMATPEPTSRRGPILSASVPRMPSE